MKRQYRRGIGLLVVTLVMCASVVMPVALYAQEADPVEVCYGQTFEAWLAGEGSDPSIFAEDVTMTSIVGDMVTTYSGRDEVLANMDELMANGFAYELEVLSVEGSTVTVETRMWDNDARALGVAPYTGTEVCVVKDGQIQSTTWTMSDESLAAFGAALAALPETGGASVPIYGWLVVGGLVLVATGLGWWRKKLVF
jgi:LPXTG-motif cell wall-anchored protein